MERVSVTESELLQAIQEAMDTRPTADGLTAYEVYEMLLGTPLHMSIDRVRRTLKQLLKAGRVELVRVERERWDGTTFMCNGIRLKVGT